MSDISQSVRPSKREAIVDDNDESANDQPVAKSVKIEVEDEPVPSSEVAELQQKVLKLEDKLQSAYFAARTAELRAEAAESRLDSKYGIKEGLNDEKKRADDLETRLAEVSSRLDAAKKRAENVFIAKVELSRENDELKMELAELKRSNGKKHGSSVSNDQHDKVKDLKNQLEEERRGRNEDLSRYRSKVDHLTDRLEEYRTRYRRSDEMAEKLAQYEEGPQPLEYGCHLNIFRIPDPKESQLTSYEKACASILSAVNEQEGEVRDVKIYKCIGKLPELKYLVLHCEACKRNFNNMAIIQHFLSHQHKWAVRERGNVVSDIALRFWMDKLTQPKPQHQSAAGAVDVPARPMQHPAAPENEAFNIFRLCRSETIESIPFERAHADLFSVIHAHEGSTTEILKLRFAKLPQLYNLVLQCEMCNMTLRHFDIIMHFNSKSHLKKVRSHNATVWGPAIKNWIDMLKPDGQSMQQPGDSAVSESQPAAATAASPDVNETQEEIKMEIKEEDVWEEGETNGCRQS